MDQRAEALRLSVLTEVGLDASGEDAAFADVVRIAARLFDVPVALVSFVGEREQFFKGRFGFDACSADRDSTFCAHAIAQDDVLVVPNALADPSFSDNPFVTGDPFIRFYAGAPVVTRDGRRLGSVCVIDRKPRPPFDEAQCHLLRGLARMVAEQVEGRHAASLLRGATRLAAATPNAIVVSDEAGRITFFNAAAERLLGYDAGEVIGTPVARLVPEEHRVAHAGWTAQLLAAGERTAANPPIDVRALKRDGTRFPVEIFSTVWKGASGLRLGSILHDNSERDGTRERMSRLTHFDRLTDLPNRSLFVEQVERRCHERRGFAVLQAGLDGFKTVNGTLGMAAGDRVLVEAAVRLRDVAGPTATLARLGADEFGVLLIDEAADAAEDLAKRLIDRLGQPFHVGASLCHLGASVGIALGTVGVAVADCVLKRALLALRHAKLQGGARYTLFRPELGRQVEERRQLEEELRGALARSEFELHFQPQVTLPDGALVGAEALLRWRHPERGLLSPAQFLPVLETSQMAGPVGRWIMTEACAFAAAMTARGVPLRVGVNLFAAQLRDAGIYDDVVEALASSGLPPSLFELEITETTVLGLDDATIEPLRRLRALGSASLSTTMAPAMPRSACSSAIR